MTDDQNVLQAETVSFETCECCGRTIVVFRDERGAVVAEAGLEDDELLPASERLKAMYARRAAISDQDTIGPTMGEA